ncbi:MAG: 8-amino-7-oxononanoate synthase [Lentisphaerae bacterium]|nr:8-amino-7-oxononanoate synthase [Lentisphaerota bacterium]
MTQPNEEWIKAELAELRRNALERTVPARLGTGGRIKSESGVLLNFSSNDYLNLANDRRLIEAAGAAVDTGVGATASRLMAGSLQCHDELEKKLAVFKGYSASLVFGSGYLTNIGIIPALVGRGDTIYADKFVHASIVDGMILSRARVRRFAHNNIKHLKKLLDERTDGKRRLVVTESVFSMDGDQAPLMEIAETAAEGDAMTLVDEAHAIGMFGPNGSGLVRQYGLESSVNICMGTLSKALGSYGGFVACSDSLRALLVNRARSFIYSTALPPMVIAAAGCAVGLLESKACDGAPLVENAKMFRSRLQAAGLNTGSSASQIVPVIIGSSSKTLAVARRLLEKGILAVAVRPPTVPTGTARLRISITLAHTQEDLARTTDAIIDCARHEGII